MYGGGKRPYEGLSAEQTAVYVDDGGRLDRPSSCPPNVYQVMCRCWTHCPISRPSARQLFNLLTNEHCDVTHLPVSSSLQQVRLLTQTQL